MLRYIEYYSDGTIFHICEVDIADPPGVVHPVILGAAPDSEEVVAHEARLAEHREYGRGLQLASLIDSHERYQAENAGRGIYVLPDNAPTPTFDGHKFDITKGKVRVVTAAEKKARDDEQASVDAEFDERVTSAVTEALVAAGVVPKPKA